MTIASLDNYPDYDAYKALKSLPPGIHAYVVEKVGTEWDKTTQSAAGPKVDGIDPVFGEMICRVGIGGHAICGKSYVGRRALEHHIRLVHGLKIAARPKGNPTEASVYKAKEFYTSVMNKVRCREKRALDERMMGHAPGNNPSLNEATLSSEAQENTGKRGPPRFQANAELDADPTPPAFIPDNLSDMFLDKDGRPLLPVSHGPYGRYIPDKAAITHILKLLKIPVEIVCPICEEAAAGRMVRIEKCEFLSRDCEVVKSVFSDVTYI